MIGQNVNSKNFRNMLVEINIKHFDIPKLIFSVNSSPLLVNSIFIRDRSFKI